MTYFELFLLWTILPLFYVKVVMPLVKLGLAALATIPIDWPASMPIRLPMSENDVDTITGWLAVYAYFYTIAFFQEANILGLSWIERIPRIWWWVFICLFMFCFPTIVAIVMMFLAEELGIEKFTLGHNIALIPSVFFYYLSFYYPEIYINRLIAAVYESDIYEEEY